MEFIASRIISFLKELIGDFKPMGMEDWETREGGVGLSSRQDCRDCSTFGISFEGAASDEMSRWMVEATQIPNEESGMWSSISV